MFQTINKTSLSSFCFCFFNWRKIALQCCVGFCHTTTWISHNYTDITSLLSLPPLLPSHPTRSSQSSRLGSLCYIVTSHQLSVLHRIAYICQCYFLSSFMLWWIMISIRKCFPLTVDLDYPMHKHYTYPCRIQRTILWIILCLGGS